MVTRKFFLEPSTKAFMFALVALGLVAAASLGYDGRVRVRERELANAFREISIFVVAEGMTPRQAIAYARTNSPVPVEIGTSLSDRNANAFKNEDIPEAFDSAEYITFGTTLRRGISGTTVYGNVNFEHKRAVHWAVGGIGAIDYRAEEFSGGRKQ